MTRNLLFAFALVTASIGAVDAQADGVAQNDVEALKWYRMAAEQGDAKAQYNLGAMYNNGGEGVDRDYVLAHMWLNLSQVRGDEGARKYMPILVKRMTKEQIAEAQKMAREWKGKHQSVEGE